MNKWYSLSVAALIAVAGIWLLAPPTVAEEADAPELELETVEQRASYAIGVSIGRDIRQQDIGLDAELITRGIRDAFDEEPLLLDDQELEQAMLAMQELAMEAQMREAQEAAQANRAAGEAFLEANQEREGVQVAESGLQYKVLEEGDGPVPGPADHVRAHYEGSFLDGETFDSSYERGQPITLPVQGVIAGWSEALQMMPVGSKWRLFIPSDLAYGEQGTGPIGPNQTLIFEVELLGIVEPEDN